MSTPVLGPSVTEFVNRVMFHECSHSAEENVGLDCGNVVYDPGSAEPRTALAYRDRISACVECLTREATRFAAQMIAVGRGLERESNDSAASVSRGAQR